MTGNARRADALPFLNPTNILALLANEISHRTALPDRMNMPFIREYLRVV